MAKKRIAVLKVDYIQGQDNKIAILEFGGGNTSGTHGVPGGVFAFNQKLLEQLLVMSPEQPLYLSPIEGFEAGSLESGTANLFVTLVKNTNPNAKIDTTTVSDVRKSTKPAHLLIRAETSKLSEFASIELQQELKSTPVTVINGSNTLPPLTMDKAFASSMMRHFLPENERSYRPQEVFIGANDSESTIEMKISALPEKQYLIKAITKDSQVGILLADSIEELRHYLQLIHRREIAKLKKLLLTENKLLGVELSCWQDPCSLIIQELVYAKTITVNEKQYNPTGRAFFIVELEGKDKVAVNLLYSYWVLPRQEATSVSTFLNSISHLGGRELDHAPQSENDQQVINLFLCSDEFKQFMAKMLSTPVQELVNNVKQREKDSALFHYLQTYSLAFAYPALCWEQIGKAQREQLSDNFAKEYVMRMSSAINSLFNQLERAKGKVGLAKEIELIHSMYYTLMYTHNSLNGLNRVAMFDLISDKIKPVFTRLISVYSRHPQKQSNEVVDNIRQYQQQYAYFQNRFNLPSLVMQSHFSDSSPNFFSTLDSFDYRNDLKALTGYEWKYNKEAKMHWVNFDTEIQRNQYAKFLESKGVKIQSTLTKTGQPIIVLRSLNPQELKKLESPSQVGEEFGERAPVIRQ
ncbi:hypothetical protein BN59_02465 [Legionella massiliensis]|uniref:Uncharacterized protein n=1 Tax=Legionella massiliensis TaxID=1034943 RepID=A0A078L2D2_9GAMM|nr:hypothetical protein [Legionella massiliensis]CDZ78158.1 hypothetical protein BN59_02465 [Legionella massiliensis]CEE13896.1 hypothetical protein BN1094_02465 [Legionella massiliensis]